MLTLLTTITLLFAPTQAPTQAPAPAVEQPEYGAAIDELRQADADANLDPAAATTALTSAISALENFAPELSDDAETRALRQSARLNLARAHLLADHQDDAERIMDDAIRDSMGDVVPAADFGPSLDELYTQRVDALESLGRASLVVSCELPCKVYVNERELGTEPPPLLLGTYRVWIEDTTGRRSDKREQVELSEADQVVGVEFADLRPEATQVLRPGRSRARIMPRWAEIALIVTGVGLTTTGGVLLGIDGNTRPNGRIYQTLTGGIIGTVAGVATLLPGVITLSVDERRLAGKTGRQATVSWTMRF
ncbi:hypothetical protein [Enhygromyxa salina]|uniref:PEGA domain-containing protein n=1 Tax=Enhygromyxa salina TaxID=215803 RepID=A0A2S9Y8F4_9BACT|nr:hypothetical protein [Enhygromyxa salina]PRQ01301.1 hypothetical protein ENSA7_59060 [Enhygromyxa salina]